MTNEKLKELWDNRSKQGSLVRNPVDGKGQDSDFMTIDSDGGGHFVYERKPGSTVWELVP